MQSTAYLVDNLLEVIFPNTYHSVPRVQKQCQLQKWCCHLQPASVEDSVRRSRKSAGKPDSLPDICIWLGSIFECASQPDQVSTSICKGGVIALHSPADLQSENNNVLHRHHSKAVTNFSCNSYLVDHEMMQVVSELLVVDNGGY